MNRLDAGPKARTTRTSLFSNLFSQPEESPDLLWYRAFAGDLNSEGC
jgi:hypothetical protein